MGRARLEKTRPSDPGPVRVLHRDAELLVLDKPSGLPTTHPSGGDCLVARARELDAGAPRLHASSRLDAPVTGVVTFARSGRAIEQLLAARRTGRYHRGYLALAAAAPEPAEGVWQRAIAIDPRDKRKRAAVDDDARGAKPARTRYRVLARADGAVALWLEPETGRTHQLRVHAADAGVPLLGDRQYGGAPRLVRADGRTAAARRVMLHCARVELTLEERGEPRLLESPLPEDMRALWEAAGGGELTW